MPHFRLTRVTPEDAEVICGWRYGPGYGLYDLGPADRDAFLAPDYLYYTVWRDGRLVGFACFGEDAQVYGGPYGKPALDLGCGLAPELCGKGLGPAFFGAIVAFACRTFRPRLLRLTVAASNLRAIRVYERAGFATSSRFAGMTRGGTHPFLLMTRKPD